MSTALEQLNTLPNHVQTAFGKLLQFQQLDDEAMGDILLARDLDPKVKRHPQRLFAFATGYLFLRIQGIPVSDTLRMSSQMGRRINVEWSPARWKDEHDKMSRLITLRSMATQNVMYDQSIWMSLLPERYRGYLIRSSGRLGMEGLRQRHCVASRHQSLVSGRIAILSVFVERQRWTVTISLTGNPESPLRIPEVKGRFNRTPPRKVMEQIHDMLGVKRQEVRDQCENEAPHHVHIGGFSRILPILRRCRVLRAVVCFDGAGDSGCIEGVNYDFEEGAEDQDVVLREEATIPTIVREFDENTRSWNSTVVESAMSLNDAITHLTDEYLATTNVNWYDSDGGFGELTLDVEAGTVHMDVNVRFTDTECEFSQEIDLVTGEEIA